jgi:cell division protein FtsI (penicillin-binding protein 3)
MLDSPKATPQTYGFTTAGWTAAPTVSKVISRIGPMLGMFPDTVHAPGIDAQLAISLDPAVPAGYRALGPGNDPGDPRNHPPEKPDEKPEIADRQHRHHPIGAQTQTIAALAPRHLPPPVPRQD